MTRVAVAGCLVILGCAKSSSPPADMPRLDDTTDNTTDNTTTASNEPARTHPVLRPTFVVEGKTIRAGTAFVLKLSDQRPLLVTAFHLFGRAGGHHRDLTWNEVPRLATSASATSVEDANITVSAGPPLAIEGAEGMSDTRVGGDVAALPILDGSRAGSLVAAPATPGVGTRVTLLAEVIGGTIGGHRHGATVVEVTDEAIAYKFDQPIEIRATSGAAVVDDQNRVIAINLGGGSGRDGSTIGVGNPITSFEPAIRRALLARPR